MCVGKSVKWIFNDNTHTYLLLLLNLRCIINQLKDVQGCRITDLCMTLNPSFSLWWVTTDAGATNLQIPTLLTHVIRAWAHLIDYKSPILPPQSTMEWTKLQSKTWHCRKAAWPSSFIRLIEEVNSRLHVPWLPLTPLIEVCYMANLQVHHFVIMDLVKFKTQRYRIRRPMLQHKS